MNKSVISTQFILKAIGEWTVVFFDYQSENISLSSLFKLK